MNEETQQEIAMEKYNLQKQLKTHFCNFWVCDRPAAMPKLKTCVIFALPKTIRVDNQVVLTHKTHCCWGYHCFFKNITSVQSGKWIDALFFQAVGKL